MSVGLALSALACGEDAPVQGVNVGGLAVVPAGNPLSAFNDLLVVHPKAMVGVAYDSNVQATSPAQSDEYLRLAAGATAFLRMNEEADAFADAEIEDLRYRTNTSLDLVGGRALVAAREHGSVAQLGVQAGASRDESRQFETGVMTKLQTYEASANAAYKALYSSYGLDLTADRQQFLEDTPLFRADQGSHDDVGLGVTAGWDYASEASIFVHAVCSHTQYFNDAIYDNSNGVGLRLGWRGAIGDRSRLSAEAGIDYRRYLDVGNKLPPFNQENAYAPAVAVTLTWPWSGRSRLDATVTSAVADGATSDAAWSMDLGVHLVQELTRLLSCGIGTDVAQVRNLSAPVGAAREIRTSLTLACGLDVHPRAGLVWHVGAQYLDSHSSTAVSYNDFQLLTQIAYAY